MRKFTTTTICALLLSLFFAGSLPAEQRGIGVRPVSPSGRGVTGTQWLFVIGVDTYIHWPRLKTAVNDAKAIKDVLLSRYYFDKDHLIELYDEQATRKNIIGKLRYLAKEVKKNDSVVIFYAGHGHLDTITKEGSWIPVESGTKDASAWISNHKIRNYLKVDAIKAKHVLLISDSCFSGDFFRGHRGKLPEVTNEVIKRAYKLTSRQAITSGGLEPVSDEGFGKNSVFSHFLVNSLRENQKPFLVASDFFPDIKAGVAENADQFPRFGSLRGTGGQQGGELVLFLKEDRDDEVLSTKALERKKELERLKQLEAATKKVETDAKAAKIKKELEIERKKKEIVKLDERIKEMKKRLSKKGLKPGDRLGAMLTIVLQKEEQERKLENLRNQREQEAKKRQKEIFRLKWERLEKIISVLSPEVEKYNRIASSKYGKGMRTQAWKILISKCPTGWADGVKEGYAEALLVPPDEREEWEIRKSILKQANDLIEKGDLEKATKILSEISVGSPNSQEIFASTAKVLEKGGNKERLKEIYKKILSLDRKNEIIIYNMGIVEYEDGNLKGSLPYLTQYIKLHPKDAAVREILFDIYMRQGDQKTTFRQAQILVDLKPRELALYDFIFEYLKGQGDYETMIPIMEKGVQANPKQVVIREYLTVAYLKTGKEDLAIKQLDGMHRLRPKDMDLLLNLARLQDKRNLRKVALKTYKKVLELSPDHEEASNAYLRLRFGGTQLVRSQNDARPGKSRIFVETEPQDARIRILNIKPKFHQGIELKPGRYYVEVSASRYKTKKRWVDLSAGEVENISILLEPVFNQLLSFKNVTGSFVSSKKGRHLFVIRGLVINKNSKSQDFVLVKGTILDDKGKVVKQKLAYCGNTFSVEELKAIPMEKINRAMENRFGRDRTNLNVAPGASIPFMIVFGNLPDNLDEFTVEAVSSSPTPSSSTSDIIKRDGNYVVYANGIVRDTKTGLEWKAGPDKNTNWDEAGSWVQNLNLDGGGWRMPTTDELEGLYKRGTGDRNITPMLKMTGWLVWSGETKGSSKARYFAFLGGGSRYWTSRGRSKANRAFAVRSRSDIRPMKSRIFVEAQPQDARIRILNIKPNFHQGMELKPGKYHVDVSSDAYETEKRWVSLVAGEDKTIQVRLAPSRNEDLVRIQSDPHLIKWRTDENSTPLPKSGDESSAYISKPENDVSQPSSTHLDPRIEEWKSDKRSTPLPISTAPEVVKRDGIYVAYANGIVKDTNTGLEWKVGPDRDTDWNEAKS